MPESMQDNPREKNSMSNLRFFFMMIIAVCAWAFAFPFIKIGLKELSFINLTIARIFLVDIILILILIFGFRKFSKINRKDVLPIFLLGFFGFILYHLGLNYGERLVSPGAASLIIATIPVFTLIFALIFLKEKLTFRKFIGIILSLIGVIIISIWGTESASIEIQYLSAAFAILLAAMLGAFYTVAGKKMLERYSALSLMTYAMLLGSVGLIPLIRFNLVEQLSQMSFQGWFAVVFLASFSTIVGYLIWYLALEIKNASEVSIYLYAIPILSTIISYFLFNDIITLFFYLGGALIITGLISINLKIKYKRDTIR